jgi:UPF0716 family protein affecting phage T7 exclusion
MNALMIVIVLVSEWWLLYEMGVEAGALPVVAWLLLTVAAGLSLFKRQALAMRQVMNDLRPVRFGPFQVHLSRQVEPERVADTMLLLVAAALFVVPGLVTDGIALTLLVPSVRQYLSARFFHRVRGATTRTEGPRTSTRREGPRHRTTGSALRPDIEVIPPGRMSTPFRPRPRIIDVN